MPYNTRRKSLSLSSLGIHVPVTHAARAAAAAAAAAATATNASDNPRSSISHRQQAASVVQGSHRSDYPQNKRIKRWHNDETQNRVGGLDSVSMTAVRTSVETRKYDHTPPPSPDATPTADAILEDDEIPGRSFSKKRVNLDGIKDDIVEAVISQLVATGNRPHLVKELAAVLSQRLAIVQHSANPCAIISSRLSTFLKRSCWTALAPCPVAKELEAVHPRRTYYFLTTCPRQTLPMTPSAGDLQALTSRASPSISSDSLASDLAEAEAEARRELSPSPEVDLSSPELDEMDDEIETTSTSKSPIRHTSDLQRERRSRGVSPPLEKDEKEFTQTANGLQKRRIGSDVPPTEAPDSAHSTSGLDESLFCDNRAVPYGLAGVAMVVSPAIKPSHPTSYIRKDVEGESWHKLGGLLDWDHMPENMELEELDCLLESC